LAILLCTSLISGVTSTAPCDKSLIKGVSADFDYTNKELKCNGGKVIEVDGAKYDSLKCDKTNGWTDGANP
ncbi:hypothetical protein PFISCL1PPCAC_24977, partial [Pristionchus fissidentatus]